MLAPKIAVADRFVSAVAAFPCRILRNARWRNGCCRSADPITALHVWKTFPSAHAACQEELAAP
jgi:hypothetical protein